MSNRIFEPNLFIFRALQKKVRTTISRSQIPGAVRVGLALTLFGGVMTTPDIFGNLGEVHANSEDSNGAEISLAEEADRAANAKKLPELQNLNTANNGNNQQACEIVVVSPGTIGSNIENRVLSSKLLGGRAGTAHVNATNSSYSISIDNPVGFSTMPVGGSNSVVMNASFMGNGDTNFSERPGNIEVRLKRGLTVVQAHLTAERTDGNPFPAGYYGAELTLRCE